MQNNDTSTNKKKALFKREYFEEVTGFSLDEFSGAYWQMCSKGVPNCDSPPDQTERFSMEALAFQLTRIGRFPIRSRLSMDNLYELTCRLKRSYHELMVKNATPSTQEAHWSYYGPAHQIVEESYRAGNLEGVLQGVFSMLDKIIHE